MRDGWQHVALGDLLSLQRRPASIHPDAAYKLVTLAVNGRGARLRREVTGADVGTAKYQVRAGDLMISKIDARKGANALLPDVLDGAVVTGDFLSYEIDPVLALASYVDLWVRRPEFAALCDTVSGGTTNRVRLDPTRFLKLSLPLPSLGEQRHIVDLVCGVDDALDAGTRYVKAARERSGVCTASLWTTHQRVRLENVGRLMTGATPSTSEPSFWDAGDHPFVTPSDLAWGGWKVELDGVGRRVSRAAYDSSKRRLEGSAVLQVCIGATAGKVGVVQGPALCNQQINAVTGLSATDARVLAAILASPAFQQQLRVAAGSSTMPLVPKGTWSGLEVPWPRADTRARLASELEALERVLSAGDGAHRRLQDLRANLLNALLSGEHGIPDSYDELLAG